MRSGVPWSVKGIEPEAREAAKQAARRAGVTLGAWLNQVIMEGGTDEVTSPSQNASAFGETQVNARPESRQHVAMPEMTSPERIAIDMAPVTEAMRDIVSRVEQSERRNQELARRMEQTVNVLSERLEETERNMDHSSSDVRTLDPLERKIQQLSERLEAAEAARKSGGTRRAGDESAQMQTLEKAVSAVVDHLETAERRTDDSLAEIRRTLSSIAERVDEREQQEAREEAEARAHAAEEQMKLMAARLEKMEQSVSNVGGSAVDAALKAIAERDDAERSKSTITNLQSQLSEITQRLAHAEQRTDATLKTFEATVSNIAKRLEDMDTHRSQDLSHEIEARDREIYTRLEEMSERLHQNEEMSISAAQTIERAIAGMSDHMHSAETRSRETTDNLNLLLERMTDRLGRIERETKATRSSLKQSVASGNLSPQVNVGVPAGRGEPFPGGQAFPIPNFDAPALGGGFGPMAEFRRPDVRDTFHEAPPVPMPTPEVTPAKAPVTAKAPNSEYISDVPPPFVSEDENGRVEPRLDSPARRLTDDIVDDDLDDELDAEPVMEQPGRAEHDFMAAARRAAQAAALAGANGPQAGMGQFPNPNSPRYAAMQPEESKARKFIFASLAVFIVAAIAYGAYHMLAKEPVIVSTTKPVSTDVAPADMGANTQTTTANATPTTVPSTATNPADATPSTTNPEAKPEDVEAADKAKTSTSTTTVVPAPAPARPAKKETSSATITPAPSATPAPSKPVTSSPLGNVSSDERNLRSAAVAGDAAAQYEVGLRYANGDNVPQDLKQAAYWYGQAATQGLAIAQYRLAALYEKGRGVAKDDVLARRWYEQAASKGNIKAMHNLAVIYAEGRGTKQDFKTAARWFGEAADHGLGDSEYNLAILEERGLGIPQDMSLAYKWFAIAAKGGDQGAAKKRDEIASKLDANKLSAIKAVVAKWQPKKADPVANGDLSSIGGRVDTSASNANAGDMTGSIEKPAARNDVAQAQAALIKLGYNPGSSDGLMGPRTREAIAAYQRSAGLEETGNVNAATLKSLELATR